ncbi:THAP domain-containing protein 5-like [Macrobrachium rosenbergii]|uniref:THAP domain-containing protein 5-like n=1 Tax=Macrobrachium rosenbergii TaxID=79674 RepID=UPI0034D74793
MPYHCVVPNCKGNYETGSKVNIFSFLKNEELAAKWIRAIKRESYTPTKYSKVCSLQFVPEDIIREKSCYDKNTGTTSTTKLKMPQLREGAIPSQLPNCPSYLSGPSHRRESPDSKRARREQSAMQAAIAESVAIDILYTNSRLFSSVDELVGKLQFLDT